MTWRKREIMDEIHSCSYYCDRPECIKAQRDELRDKMAQPEQEPVQDSTCNETLRGQGKAYPRTCKKCGLGPCIGAPKQPPAQPAPVQEPVAGMVLVPYEPCLEMQEQGSAASGYDLSQARAKRVYQAMIDMCQVLEEKEPSDQWYQLNAGYTTPPAAQPAPVQKRPQNCGTGYCSCVECVMEPEQEPVAWMNRHGACKTSLFRDVEAGAKEEYTVPLYTTPPQRTWVGLTDKEAMQICEDCGCLSEDWLVLLDAIEAKLKEKNFD